MMRVRRAAAMTSVWCLAAALAASPAHGDDTATAILNSLAIHPKAAMAGYSRDQFGTAWTDDNDDEFGHNHCDTRDDILARDLDDLVKSGRCEVVSGVLNDPYTAAAIPFHRGPQTSTRIQIDHVVALGDAWMTGAQQLTPRQRVDLANDPRNLLAVDGPANNRKRDMDASEWLPPSGAFACTYVADQVHVKAIYHLWVTQAEHDAMARVLAGCP